MTRGELFPEIEPYEHGMLRLDGLHEMYWEQSGNAQGTPALFLHGGPGAGAGAMQRRFFDPGHYRIIVFDQRGAGRSMPYGEIKDNTTSHLVADMETLRRHLGVEKWLLFGGSWGAALAMAYGAEHPSRCIGFILRGVFLGRAHEIEWFLSGMATVFPEAGRAFSEFLPERERADPLEGYYLRLIDPDPGLHMPAARAWCAYESSCSYLEPNIEPRPPGNAASLAMARIEAHYFKHSMFLGSEPLLGRVGPLGAIPAIIVHGRYDMICPIANAYELARAWPQAQLRIIPRAGHSALEPDILRALVEATDEFSKLR